MRQNLLDFLADANQLFISDLRRASCLPQVLLTVESVIDDQYPVYEWNETLTYIFNKKVSFPDVPAAKAYFKSRVQSI